MLKTNIAHRTGFKGLKTKDTHTFEYANKKICFLARVCLCAWSLRHVWLCATPWTVAHQALLPMGIFQTRILEWVAMPSSKRSCQPRDWAWVSHIVVDSLPSEPPGKAPAFWYSHNRYLKNWSKCSCFLVKYERDDNSVKKIIIYLALSGLSCSKGSLVVSHGLQSARASKRRCTGLDMKVIRY